MAASAAAAVPESIQVCGCKGIRTCLICEGQRHRDPPWKLSPQKPYCFLYCLDTGWAVGAEDSDYEGWAFPFPGVTVIEDFVTLEEETEMVHLMDRDPWKLSQSGRRKQDYGPRVNFRKQKLKMVGFQGLPGFSQRVIQRMGLYPGLEDFQPVEQCNLDYSPERGSAIDPHLDDAWLWGERLVSLNLLSPTVVSMACDDPGSLLLCSAPSAGSSALADSIVASSRSVPRQEVEVAISIPAAPCWYWLGLRDTSGHMPSTADTSSPARVCSTFRELSEEFLPGGKQQELGRQLLQVALTFQGRPV